MYYNKIVVFLQVPDQKLFVATCRLNGSIELLLGKGLGLLALFFFFLIGECFIYYNTRFPLPAKMT